jgi:single-stranded-DNA-specific exonuclease
MGENRHVRFTVEAGGVRAKAVAFGTAGKIQCEADGPVDATFTLELNEWNGSVEPRLVLRCARPSEPAPVEVVGEAAWLAAALAEATPARPLAAEPGSAGAVRDRRGGGLAGTIHGLVASGERVLVVCAHVERRLRHLRGRVGGFALTSEAALRRDPAIVGRFDHVVLMDPGRPPVPAGPMVHLAWGPAEVDWTLSITQHEHDLRAALTAIYRALRAKGTAAGEELEGALREGDPLRSPHQAGAALRVLEELGLVSLDPDRQSAAVAEDAERTSLDRSAAFRAYIERNEDEQRFLGTATTAGREAQAAA